MCDEVLQHPQTLNYKVTVPSKPAKLRTNALLIQVKVTYPIGWRGTEPIYFGALIGGPHLIDDVSFFFHFLNHFSDATVSD